MTRDKDFKKLVRQRMQKTGEAYSTARRQLEQPRAQGTLDGWCFTGQGVTDYEGGLDPEFHHDGKPCAFLRHVGPPRESHAVILQTVDADRYRAKRVRFSAWFRGDADVPNGALFLSARSLDGATVAHALGKGGADWRRVEVVLDVPAAARSIAFGLAMGGPGATWMSDARLEVVEASVATTGSGLPLEPRNLAFDG